MQNKPPRHKLYTLLAVGKKQLAMDEDTYRAFLQKYGAKKVDGRVSASTMDFSDLFKAVEAMKKAGFVPAKKGITQHSNDWRTARIKKITAIWFTLHEARVVKDISDKAMQHWCSSISKKPVLKWATSEDLNHCIEALKSWAARERVKLK